MNMPGGNETQMNYARLLKSPIFYGLEQRLLIIAFYPARFHLLNIGNAFSKPYVHTSRIPVDNN